jgi:hypothetical protein
MAPICWYSPIRYLASRGRSRRENAGKINRSKSQVIENTRPGNEKSAVSIRRGD